MNIINHIKDLREIVNINWSVLTKTSDENKNSIKITRVYLSDREIHGGLGTRADIREINFTRTGWEIYRYEEERNPHYYQDLKIQQKNRRKMDDNELENYLNGKDCTVGEVLQFIDTYNKIAKEFGRLNLLSNYTI